MRIFPALQALHRGRPLWAAPLLLLGTLCLLSACASSGGGSGIQVERRATFRSNLDGANFVMLSPDGQNKDPYYQQDSDQVAAQLKARGLVEVTDASKAKYAVLIHTQYALTRAGTPIPPPKPGKPEPVLVVNPDGSPITDDPDDDQTVDLSRNFASTIGATDDPFGETGLKHVRIGRGVSRATASANSKDASGGGLTGGNRDARNVSINIYDITLPAGPQRHVFSATARLPPEDAGQSVRMSTLIASAFRNFPGQGSAKYAVPFTH